MSLTLNIAQSELSDLGKVHRPGKGNFMFSEVRLFSGPEDAYSAEALYVCDDKQAASALVDAGAHYLFVGSDSSKPDPHADLSVIGGEPLLVVFNALLSAMYRFSDWERQMDKVFFTGGDLQDLMDVSSDFLRNNVVIVDPALKLLAYTKDIPCDDPITMELIEHGYHTEDNIRKFKLHKRFKPWAEENGFVINDTYEICKYVTVVKSFKTRSSFSIIIIMMCNVVQADDYLLDVYDLFAQRVELFAKRDYPDDKPAGNAADTFLKDLFTGDIRTERTIAERCRHVGVPFESRFCLFYIEAGKDPALRPRLLSDVSRLVAPAKTVLIGNAIIVLCFSCMNESCMHHCELDTCPFGRRSISGRINDVMDNYGLICGRSSRFSNLTQAYIAFRQAHEAYRIGCMKSLVKSMLGTPHNWSRIYSFDSCCIDYLVERANEKDDDLVGATYARTIIDEIARQDAETRTDNYLFLYTYLMCERRTSVVAEKLHMHRNNVNYRIDRIEEQFGIDTSDPILRLDLLFAYRICEAGSLFGSQ